MSDLIAAGRPEWAGRPPAVHTSLVGRREECATVRALLLRPSARLVTLTGPGGVGKTRLAVQVATNLDTGFEAIAFVALASVRDPRLVEVTIAGALGLAGPDGTIADALRNHLRQKSTLLVLDNFEHLLDAGPVLADLLANCPGLTLLVTSRARLRISAEHVVGVAPLPLPEARRLPPVTDLGTYDSVRLFVERAQAALPDFALSGDNAADVVEICRRLDGLPLAIELAAARTTVLPPAAMLSRLERRLPVLTSGPREQPERLRTMRAGIAWSYDLLSPAEQAMFRRLGAFAGACTLAAAESVGQQDDRSDVLDLVSGLVDKSLLRRVVDGNGEARFTMLETIREYAVEQLVASGEEEAARGAHAVCYRDLAERASPELRGPEQRRWREALEAELDDLRVALTWTLRDMAGPDDVDNGLRLVGALWYFWFQRGLTGEGRRWLTRALDRGQGQGLERAQALLGAGTLAWRQGDCDTAHAYLDESMRLWQELGDTSNLAETLHVLGHVRFDQRDYHAARRLFIDSLDGYRCAGDTLGSLPLNGDLALVAYHEGDYGAATEIWRDSVALYRQHGLTDRVAGALNGLGDLARLAGEVDRAATFYQESLSLWRELRGTPGVASALHKLGQVSRSRSDARGARAHFVESMAMQRELGNKQGIAECLAGLAGVATDSGTPRRAVQLFAAANQLLEAIGVPLAPADQHVLSQDLDAAREQLEATAWDTAWTAGRALTPENAIALATADDTGPPPHDDGTNQLSRREREISALLAQGLTNRQIATTLSISEKTVGSHIEHIMNKLGLRSRTRIALWAVAHGLGPTPSG